MCFGREMSITAMAGKRVKEISFFPFYQKNAGVHLMEVQMQLRL